MVLDSYLNVLYVQLFKKIPLSKSRYYYHHKVFLLSRLGDVPIRTLVGGHESSSLNSHLIACLCSTPLQ